MFAVWLVWTARENAPPHESRLRRGASSDDAEGTADDVASNVAIVAMIELRMLRMDTCQLLRLNTE